MLNIVKPERRLAKCPDLRRTPRKRCRAIRRLRSFDGLPSCSAPSVIISRLSFCVDRCWPFHSARGAIITKKNRDTRVHARAGSAPMCVDATHALHSVGQKHTFALTRFPIVYKTQGVRISLKPFSVVINYNRFQPKIVLSDIT